MESFIVRIYRRAGGPVEDALDGSVRNASAGPTSSGPIGTVEATATGERVTFHSDQELLSALASGLKPKTPAGKPAAKPGRASATARIKK
jgi:hypothetical protein